MTTSFSMRLPRPTPVRVATLALTLTIGLGLEGCTSWFGGKSDYQTGSQRTQPLEVPPDLSQLQKDSRYLPQGGVVAASDLGKPGVAASAPVATTVAVETLGDMHVERIGNQRYLVSARSPEVLWPLVRDFWLGQGFKIAEENPTAGYIETDWLESKINLPHDFLRDSIGKQVPGMFDSGRRDRYRTRLERTATGTEITIAQFGVEEVVTGWQHDDTKWVPRANDPGLEAEMLSQMMVSLGATDQAARKAVAATGATPAGGAASGPAAAAAPTAPVRARVVAGQPGATLQVDDGFDRAWRRVGLALDHGGFTVEDRDRAQGLYFVRFVDAKEAAKDEPNWFTKAFDWFSKPKDSPVGKYRIQVKGAATSSTVTILNNQGQPDNTDNAQRIVALLLDELK
jgi:outer membrane protein assembly factor BamC